MNTDGRLMYRARMTERSGSATTDDLERGNHGWMYVGKDKEF